ncbi:XRE family transcriptional regulator [Actinomyces oricola]
MKTNTRSYEVIAHREVYPEGTWWVFSIPALDAVGQATRLADVAAEARGIISAWNESEPAPHDVRVTVRLDGEAEARRIWQEAQEQEDAARSALDAAAARRREAVALLRDKQHYSASDAARVLGVTRQRIYQLSR